MSLRRDFDYIVDVRGLSTRAKNQLWESLGKRSTTHSENAEAFFVRCDGDSSLSGMAYVKSTWPKEPLHVAQEVVSVEVLPPTTLVYDGYTYTRGEKA